MGHDLWINPGRPCPPFFSKFQGCFLFPRVETGGQKSSNPQAWHATHKLFNIDMWGRWCHANYVVLQGLNILSIYGTLVKKATCIVCLTVLPARMIIFKVSCMVSKWVWFWPISSLKDVTHHSSPLTHLVKYGYIKVYTLEIGRPVSFACSKHVCRWLLEANDSKFNSVRCL